MSTEDKESWKADMNTCMAEMKFVFHSSESIRFLRP